MHDEPEGAPPPPPLGSTQALVAGLASEGALIQQGDFSLDLARASDKLGAYRLADPQRFVVLLLEVANLLPECSGLRFELTGRETRAIFDGAYLQPAQVRDCMLMLFAKLDGLEPTERRARQGRKLLAAALNSAQHSGMCRMSVDAFGPGRSSLVWEGEGEPRFTSTELHFVTRHLSVTVAYDVPHVQHPWQIHRDYLQHHAGCSGVPVQLRVAGQLQGDAPLPGPEARFGLLDRVELHDATGRQIGVAGWSPQFGDQAIGVMVLHANGAIIEHIPDPLLPRMALAIVDASDHPRDLSNSYFIRDEALGALRVAVVSACARLTQPPPLLAAPGTKGSHMMMSSIFAGASVFIIMAGLGVAGPAALGLAGGTSLAAGLPLIMGSRYAHAETHGELKLARIERVVRMRALDIGDAAHVRARVRVELGPGEDGEAREPVTTEILIDGRTGPVDPGARVFVRMHPKHPSVIVSARGQSLYNKQPHLRA